MSSKKLLRSPICWFGGKGNMAAKLLDLVPDNWKYYGDVAKRKP